MSAQLVAIGDSATEGFLNGSISKTHLSYLALSAECLGNSDFTVPDFSDAGGLPLNFETLLNQLDNQYGDKMLHTSPDLQQCAIQQFMDTVEDYWERKKGSEPSTTGSLPRNLAVLGFQLPNCDTVLSKTAQQCIPAATDNPIEQQPEFYLYRAAQRTLNPSQSHQYQSLAQLGGAQHIAQTEGIENLIFWLGSNHCIDTVVGLKMEWSTVETLEQPLHLRTANLWRPEHFKQVLHRVASKVSVLGAKNVFVGNVPHITVPPISRGITPGAAPGMGQDENGYFEYCTHFWILDSEFDPAKHPHLTRSQIRGIDATIDQYNQIIQNEAAIQGWHLVDTANVLDRLAFRRQQGGNSCTSGYSFPPALIEALRANPKTYDHVTADGRPLLDTCYVQIDSGAEASEAKYKGGLFSLYGVHSTTLGYGLIAHEFLQVMQKVWLTQGKDPLVKPLDWQKITESDTLLTDPPKSLSHLKSILSILFGQATAPSPSQVATRRGLSKTFGRRLGIPSISLISPRPQQATSEPVQSVGTHTQVSAALKGKVVAVAAAVANLDRGIPLPTNR